MNTHIAPARTQNHLELLWQRVEDARLQWKSANHHARNINNETGSIPNVDGAFAIGQAFHTEHVAVKNYVRALEEFKTALHTPTPVEGQEALTRREREVLVLIASGKTSKEIAFELAIAFRTVVCHRYRIQRKLNTHNTADLTRAALRMRLIEL